MSVIVVTKCVSLALLHRMLQRMCGIGTDTQNLAAALGRVAMSSCCAAASSVPLAVQGGPSALPAVAQGWPNAAQ